MGTFDFLFGSQSRSAGTVASPDPLTPLTGPGSLKTSTPQAPPPRPASSVKTPPSFPVGSTVSSSFPKMVERARETNEKLSNQESFSKDRGYLARNLASKYIENAQLDEAVEEALVQLRNFSDINYTKSIPDPNASSLKEAIMGSGPKVRVERGPVEQTLRSFQTQGVEAGRGALRAVGLPESAVLPGNKISDIEKFIAKYAPDRISEVKDIKERAGNIRGAEVTGIIGEALLEGFIGGKAVIGVVKGIPAMQKMRQASPYGVHLANIIENTAASVGVNMEYGITRGKGSERIMLDIASNPSVLLPFASNWTVAGGALLDYFAARTWGGFSVQDSLINAAMGAGSNLAQRVQISGEVRSLSTATAPRLTTAMKGNIPQPLIEAARSETEIIRNYAVSNPADIPGVIKMMTMAEKRLLAYSKVLEKSLGANTGGESRTVGLKGRLTPQDGSDPSQVPLLPDETGRSPREETTTTPTEKARADRQSKLESQRRQFLEGDQPSSSLDTIPPRTPYSKRVHTGDTYIAGPRHVLKKIGMREEYRDLRTAKNLARLELQSRQSEIRNWAKAVPGEESNTRIAKFLDGQAPIESLQPKERSIVEEIRPILDSYARRLGLVPGSGYLRDYFPHTFGDKSMRAEIPEDIAMRISQQEDPASSVYNPFTTKRHGVEGYKLDTWSALDAYFRRATRSVHMDPVLSRINKKSADLTDPSQALYIKEFIDRVNFRPTRADTGLDNLFKRLESFFGGMFGVSLGLGPRPTRKITGKVNRAASRGAFWFNPKTAIRNITQGVNTYSELGELYTVIGYAEMAKKMAMQDFTELHREGILEYSIADDISVKPAMEQAWTQADRAGFSLMRLTEFFNRAPAYFGAKAKGMAEGMSEREAMEYAKDVVEDTQFRYDELGTPIGLSSDIMKTFTKFQPFTIKQTEFLGRKIKEGDVLGLARYVAGSAGILYAAGAAIGLDWTDFLPGARILEEGKYVPPILQPFFAAAAAALNVPGKFNQTRPQDNPLERIIMDKEFHKSMLLFTPGGVEGQRLYKSKKTYDAKGKISASGKSMTFPVDTSDPVNVLKLFLLGEYNTKEGQEYLKGGAKGYHRKIKTEKSAKANKSTKQRKPTK
jgi:hypothetical protein